MLEPTWKEFATTHKGLINVATVNALDEEELKHLFDIRAYPTIFIVKDGFRYIHNGGRTLNELKRFALEGGYEKVDKVAVGKLRKPIQLSGTSSVKVLEEKDFDEKTSKGRWFIEVKKKKRKKKEKKKKLTFSFSFTTNINKIKTTYIVLFYFPPPFFKKNGWLI